MSYLRCSSTSPASPPSAYSLASRATILSHYLIQMMLRALKRVTVSGWQQGFAHGQHSGLGRRLSIATSSS